jgi:2,4-dienoyl-CoA reductase-like NADH-dependent reductase (Old Yellow Enzyme family)
MKEADLKAVVQQFVDAANVAAEAGFDAVELHLGHGYLLSQFWSPVFNHRKDAYGGDREGRARLLLEVSRAVAASVGQSMAVLAKINLSDGLQGGATLEDCLWLSAELERAGVHALIPSGGTVQRTAFYLLRGGVPLSEMARGEGSLITSLAMRLLGRFLVKPYTYESGFFREDARRVLKTSTLPIGLLGGVDSSALVTTALSEGFAFVVMGRALLADPDFIERMVEGREVVSRCNHCNRCVAAMNDGGVRCVPFSQDGVVAQAS